MRIKPVPDGYVPYFYSGGNHLRLKPTGRWKIKNDGFYEKELFIEHKGFLFTKWVIWYNIFFGPPESEFINQVPKR